MAEGGNVNGSGHGSSVGPSNGTGTGSGGTIEPWSDLEQGFRCYIVDSNGILQSEVKDFWFTDIKGINTFASGSSSSKCILRVGNQTSKYTKSKVDEMNLEYSVKLADYTYNLPTLCWHGTKRCNGDVAFNYHFKTKRDENGKTSEEQYQVNGEEVTGCQYLVYNVFSDLYDHFWENEYSLVVEHVFAVDLGKGSNKMKGKKFYGSVYEWGLFCKENPELQTQAKIQSTLKLSYKYTNIYIPNSIMTEFLPSKEPGGIQDCSNLQVPSFNTTTTLTGDMLTTYAYGTAIFHGEFKPPVEEAKPKPTTQDISLDIDISIEIYHGKMTFNPFFHDVF